MKNSSPETHKEQGGAADTRRRALLLMLGLPRRLSGAPEAVEGGAPLRLAISESLVTDVNLNDARAAMTIWLNRMKADLNIAVELNPKVFDTTQEIVRRARSGQLDCVALNIIEYRQIADVLDPSQIIAQDSRAGPEQYLLLVKRNSGIQRLADLRGRRLGLLKTAKTCLAGAWLSTLLDEARLGEYEDFFGSVSGNGKASQVVLPVFFGQTDGCLTSKQSFETIYELNPQVAKDLVAIASSPPMVVTFYVFHKNYHGPHRDRFARVYSGVSMSAAGRQLATLFQFESLVARDASCLAPALALLEKADRIRGHRGSGERKG